MKNYNYRDAPKALLTPDIVAMLTSIHEHKGKQELYIEAHADALTTLMEIAKVQSTGASNAIEGIRTSDKRSIWLKSAVGVRLPTARRTSNHMAECHAIPI